MMKFVFVLPLLPATHGLPIMGQQGRSAYHAQSGDTQTPVGHSSFVGKPSVRARKEGQFSDSVVSHSSFVGQPSVRSRKFNTAYTDTVRTGSTVSHSSFSSEQQQNSLTLSHPAFQDRPISLVQEDDQLMVPSSTGYWPSVAHSTFEGKQPEPSFDDIAAAERSYDVPSVEHSSFVETATAHVPDNHVVSVPKKFEPTVVHSTFKGSLTQSQGGPKPGFPTATQLSSVTHSSVATSPTKRQEKSKAVVHAAPSVLRSSFMSTSSAGLHAQNEAQEEAPQEEEEPSVLHSSFMATSSAGLNAQNEAQEEATQEEEQQEEEEGPEEEYWNEEKAAHLDRLKKYTFDEFREQYSRSYKPGQLEFIKRKKIFSMNLRSLIKHELAQPYQPHPYTVGVNNFMDYTAEEFNKLLGYKRINDDLKSSFLQQEQGLRPQWEDAIKAVQIPPQGKDWRPQLAKSRLWFQDQGACGSCWATAAASCLQGHLEIKHNVSDLLSVQSLVSCTPNPRHCGGTGGCAGATAELAFGFIKKNGIPSNRNWKYTSGLGSDGKCFDGRDGGQNLVQKKHAIIDHYVVLPENKGQPLLQVLYQEGPVVVSVDASTWSFYQSGIFSGCKKDAVINHAVVAEGFGEQSGNKYYLIKNSWGGNWGENGYIRLMRFDDDEAHCGTDRKPQEGTACEDGPSEVKVCGMCGVLYDSTFPRGARFITKKEGGTFDRSALVIKTKGGHE